MDQQARHIAQLLYHSLASELSGVQEKELNKWLAQSPRNRLYYEQLQNEDWLQNDMKWYNAEEKHRLEQELYSMVQAATGISAPLDIRRVHFLKTSWFRYAAAILVLLSAGAYFWINSGRSTAEIAVQVTDILPGTNRATLTIGNDSTINLSNHKTGISIASNAVTYNDGERIADAGQQLMLTTPRGGQYQAVLPDGSKVWLNAASSIKFPSRFTGDRRAVEVSGEVYLEIAKNTRQPFYVRTGETEIQVLGTSFNVNTYGDEEAEKTTLVEGSIRVAGRSGNAGRSVRYDQGVILKPGQQAISSSGQQLSVTDANIEQTIAWKNGIFNFAGKTFDSFMKDIERWYNVDVRYEGEIPEKSFKGEMDRGLSMSDLLLILEEYGLKVKLSGRTLIIRDK